MTQVQAILDYLWSIAPDGATNAQIGRATGIVSHQVVYMATQALLGQRRIHATRQGREWTFYAADKPAVDLWLAPSIAASSLGHARETLTAAGFEQLAREELERVYGVQLSPGVVSNVPKRFDFASSDAQLVGDAKYYTLVGGIGLPPAKFSIIAEHVWLLEKTAAPVLFLVFGNDRNVPVLWLRRYGHLAGRVVFYFLSQAGELETLN